MSERFYLLLAETVDDAIVQGCQDLARQLADYAQEPVTLAVLAEHDLTPVRTLLAAPERLPFFETATPRTALSAAPMSAAPFVWREDGRPDWEAMWNGFCELALYGGPPHRGEESALHPPEDAPPPEVAAESEALQEIRRGIWETTGLFAEPAEPGWIAITCHSRKMAAWLCASIILENVDARCEEERLFLPAAPQFTLKNEVKSVITVLAKTNHYWQAHVESLQAAQRVGV